MAGILIGWIVFSCIAGAIASGKGNSFAAAFFISILLSPIIGIVIALVQQPNEAVIEKQRLQTGESRKCPFCAELVKREASVCRYCGREIEPLPAILTTEQWTASPPKFNPKELVKLAWVIGIGLIVIFLVLLIGYSVNG